MYYIQESDKPNKIAGLLNIVKLKDNHIILPISNIRLKEKSEYRLAVKTKHIMDKTNSKKLVLSKKTKQKEDFVNYLHSYNYEIVNGKWLFQMLLFEVLNYVIKKLEICTKEVKLAILVNNISDFAIYVIENLAIKYKNFKIVTNHIEMLKGVEEKMLRKYGIVIQIGNNKRKILSKTNIILNLDFPTELINRYKINDIATIINFNGNVRINDKRFNGLNINNYEIDWRCNPNFNKFEAKDIYEALQYKNQPIDITLKKIKKDMVKIKYLQAVKTTI